jgi:hypothetical protein
VSWSLEWLTSCLKIGEHGEKHHVRRTAGTSGKLT